jgi:hypothetical protein
VTTDLVDDGEAGSSVSAMLLGASFRHILAQ